MTNAARHSGARRIEVKLALVGPDLLIEVRDDGAGGDGAVGDGVISAAQWSPGVGLSSMRDRAAELGGSCQAGPGPGGGRVTASLPLGNGTAVNGIAVTGMAVNDTAVSGVAVTGTAVTGTALTAAELSVP
jgi:signal transduction histidine kinase